jgi:hypothetical protein
MRLQEDTKRHLAAVAGILIGPAQVALIVFAVLFFVGCRSFSVRDHNGPVIVSGSNMYNKKDPQNTEIDAEVFRRSGSIQLNQMISGTIEGGTGLVMIRLNNIGNEGFDKNYFLDDLVWRYPQIMNSLVEGYLKNVQEGGSGDGWIQSGVQKQSGPE